MLSGLSACDSGRDATAEAEGVTTGRNGEVQLKVEDPRTADDRVGFQLLKAVRPERLSRVMADTYELPRTLTVKAVPGLGGGPYYDPRHNTVVLQYGFASLVYDTIAEANPGWTQRRIGEAVGAVLSFITAHEFGHALVAIYDLPVLGREEDAADNIATLLLLAGPEGDKFALDSADFWASFSGRQSSPRLADYADVHSLDLQRALTIVCQTAGSSRQRMRQVARLGILPRSRLVGCPAEYEQTVDSLDQVVAPHLDQPLDEPSG